MYRILKDVITSYRIIADVFNNSRILVQTTIKTETKKTRKKYWIHLRYCDMMLLRL